VARPTGEAAEPAVLSLKVTLRDARPPIWRRLLVADTMTLAHLHRAIQAAMGWMDSHMHGFDVGGRQYGVRHPEDDFADETRLTLRAMRRSGLARLRYTYDFGDSWEHDVVIEKTLPAVTAGPLPRCVAGRRACPPEDCGGVWGYEELRAILADPSHPEHAERREWVGDRLDRDLFDLGAANAALRQAFSRR
jgi:hypothetical protein